MTWTAGNYVGWVNEILVTRLKCHLSVLSPVRRERVFEGLKGTVNIVFLSLYQDSLDQIFKVLVLSI